ncbi:MAG: hypothetical protein IJP92_17780 [Lachnospiraceae bacterium]|nr:hypothetical protein [Lachnospiraceae bacterium]
MNSSDRDIENKVKSSSFSNPLHKERLRNRLFEQSKRLSADDLEGVTGGVAVPLPDHWEPWDMPGMTGEKSLP